jgi:hypothetical protein
MSETVTINKDEFDALKKRLSAVETASSEAGVVVRQCNTCGDLIPDDASRCVKHPGDVTNTVGQDRFGKSVLVSQG